MLKAGIADQLYGKVEHQAIWEMLGQLVDEATPGPVPSEFQFILINYF